MPRTRKGTLPTSSRHIQRLAQKKTENDLERITITTHPHPSFLEETGECSKTSDYCIDAIVTNAQSFPKVSITPKADISIPNDNLENDNNFNDLLVDEISFPDCNFSVVSTLLPIDFDSTTISNLSSGDLDSTHRYSDSDADSIPEDDNYHAGVEDYYSLLNNRDSESQKFRNAITEWAKQYKIHHNALKPLLSIINTFTGIVFPKDSRTLLKTPTSTNVVNMDDGHYCHIGFSNALKRIIENRDAFDYNTADCINIMVHVDGAPLGSSAEKGLWTILCRDSEFENVFVIGLYHGVSKPKDPNVFLQKFVEEASTFCVNGFELNNKIFKVKIHAIICDAPAKSFILNTKYHSGYHSCSKCTIEGEFHSSVCFPVADIDSLKKYCNDNLRTDKAFENCEYLGDYQKGPSILNTLPDVGLITSIPLDCMHLAYLGIVKQKIRLWLGEKGRGNKNYKLSAAQISIISERLENLKHHLPFEFNRRSRSLKYWKLWKATEFRHFLLYFGPAILQDILPSNVYHNFLMLHVGITILSNPKLVKSNDNIFYAEFLLLEYVIDFQRIYGAENVTFNVHNLIHLARDVRKYGPLDSFSSFPFENFICSLKKLIRKGQKPLQQISRRLVEYGNILVIRSHAILNNNKVQAHKVHFNGIITDNRRFDEQFRLLTINSWNIDIKDDRNNCVMLVDGTVVNVLNIAKSDGILFLIGHKCCKVNDLYTVGYLSSGVVLCINKVNESSIIESWPCELIYTKIFKIPGVREFVTFPIIHTIVLNN